MPPVTNRKNLSLTPMPPMPPILPSFDGTQRYYDLRPLWVHCVQGGCSLLPFFLTKITKTQSPLPLPWVHTKCGQCILFFFLVHPKPLFESVSQVVWAHVAMADNLLAPPFASVCRMFRCFIFSSATNLKHTHTDTSARISSNNQLNVHSLFTLQWPLWDSSHGHHRHAKH